MAQANSEQIKAIEHFGGVLLKAGAGSGKTFVLKEHILYLAGNWIDEFKQTSTDLAEFELVIQKKLRKIVLMTFTKKAAGELELRLNNEFLHMGDRDLERKSYWDIISSNLSYLNVSTIHGFCFKLIKMGFFSDVSSEQTILSDVEFKEILFEIFEEYLVLHQQEDFNQLLLKDKQNVFKSLCGIFSDPTLRLNWNALNVNDININHCDEMVQEILNDLNFESLFSPDFSLARFSEFEGKKWYDFAKKYNGFAAGKTCNLAGLLSVYDFFEQIEFKIPAKPSLKTVDPEMVNYYEGVRDLKDYLKKNGEHFVEFNKSFDSHIKPWFTLIKSFVDHIEARYSQVEGVTFSDLEYIVHQKLTDKKVLKRIHDEFNYFIIDEFQDTSFIQYSIISKLIGDDFSRLFCVGDLKQAIYGFRGGELGVFLDCETKIPLNLSLKNNYRSAENIINFNNIFFEDIFKKGLKYTGLDKHSVGVEHQTVPIQQEEKGAITELNVDLSFFKSEEKLSNLEVDYFEALALVKTIKTLQSEDEEIAVLYKKLKPSLILINLLMKENIGFVAQTKIPFLQDPILGIFSHLISRNFDENINSAQYQQLIIENYLFILKGETFSININEEVEKYNQNLHYYGLFTSFCLFLADCGICNSNYQKNLNLIKELISAAYNDPEKLYKLFLKQKETSYSLDFYFGKDSKKVQIMSAHASKGLEFTHILLGGIYTNENAYVFSPMIGKLPFSFKWSADITNKDKYKTPAYLWEEQLNRKKDFSENKRLFYVAATRAQKNLSWVNLNLGELKRSKSQSNSWSAGIKASEINFAKEIKEIQIGKEYDSKFLASLTNAAPFFHINTLGIEIQAAKEKKYLLSELSVTRLATIAECPRKFYLQNICKFSPEDLQLVGFKAEQVKRVESEDDLSSSNIIISSAARGSEIHENLSNLVLGEFPEDLVLELTKQNSDYKTIVDKLELYLDKYELISERPIKFELFGYMISGIPDLIARPLQADDTYEIWDFKTGAIQESKLEPYFFQLYLYAYSQYVFKKLKKESPTRLVLYFFDEKEIVEKKVFYTDVEKYLTEKLQLSQTPWIQNENACTYCDYRVLCKK